MKISWLKYLDGMPIVDRFVRVLGTAQQYNEAINAADTRRVCRLPGGLTGKCEGLHGNSGVVLVFRKYEDQNQSLWRTITSMTNDNLEAGYLKVYLSASRLRGLEIGHYDVPHPRSRLDAMGVRG